MLLVVIGHTGLIRKELTVMSKKLFAGIILGGAATAASWALIPESKRQLLKERANAKMGDIADYVTDYALNALDIVDEKLAEMDDNGVTDNVKAATEKVKKTKNQVLDHLTNDEFDKQTAAIRKKLAKAHEKENDADDDIVIDATHEE